MLKGPENNPFTGVRVHIDGWAADRVVTISFADDFTRASCSAEVIIDRVRGQTLTVRLRPHRWEWQSNSFVCTVDVPEDVQRRSAAVPAAVCTFQGPTLLPPPPPRPPPSRDVGSMAPPPPPPPSVVYCADVQEGLRARFACPPDEAISDVAFASYGTPLGSCAALAFSQDPGISQMRKGASADDVLRIARGRCHHPMSMRSVEDACIGKRNCTFLVGAAAFGGGDPCPDAPWRTKRFVGRVVCGGRRAVRKGIQELRAGHHGTSLDGMLATMNDLTTALWSGNLTFSDLARDVEQHHPGIVAAFAVAGTLVACCVLAALGCLCVRLRRLQKRYAKLSDQLSAAQARGLAARRRLDGMELADTAVAYLPEEDLALSGAPPPPSTRPTDAPAGVAAFY